MTRAAAQERPYIHPLLSRAREETSLLGFVNVLLRHRRIIAATTLLATVACLASALMEPKYYSTRVLFTARGGSAGALSGIAAQLGISIVGDDPSQSIEFYEDLLRSNELLRQAAKHQYTVHTPKGVITGTLPVFYGIHAGSRDAEIDIAASTLRTAITTNATRRTGIIMFIIAAPYPELAQQIATTMMTELDRYNTQRRRLAITAERAFVEQRLAEARAALTQAENNVEHFLELNREYKTSPKLSIESDRLDREVQMRQQLYTSLSAAYDKARIEEVRDTPAISIVEPPDLPEYPDSSYGLRNTLLGAIAGMLVGIVLAFMRERMRETETEASAVYSTYKDLKRDTVADLARPWRKFRPQSS
jgi:uncharacterized protein involved in exopolysaccharide biosynthesis